MSKQQKRARGAGRWFLRGNTAWIQYSVRGRQVRESTGIKISSSANGELAPDDQKRIERVERILRKKVGAAENGLHEDSRSLRYEDIRAAFLADYELSGRKSLRHDKQGNAYLEAVRRLDNFFAGFRAVEIGPELIRKFQKEQHAAGLSNGTINRAVSALRRMFTLAQRDECLHNLPYFPMLKESKPRSGTLQHAKYDELLKELPNYLRPVVTIGFRTGMRSGEILNLRWADILWMDRIIRLPDSKNNEPREIPFSGELEAVLREQFTNRKPGCDRVCYRLDRKGHAVKIGNFRKPWRRVCVKIGVGRMAPVLDAKGEPVMEKPRYIGSKPRPRVEYAGLIFHDLRRTFVTDAEHAGAPRHEVMKISGHKTESVYKRYAIENREQRRAALAQIDSYRAKKFGDNSGTIEGSQEQQQDVSH